MKNSALAIAIFALLGVIGGVLIQQQLSETGRYQLEVPAKGEMIFVIDTKTGNVTQSFSPLTIAAQSGQANMNNLKKTYQYRHDLEKLIRKDSK